MMPLCLAPLLTANLLQAQIASCSNAISSKWALNTKEIVSIVLCGKIGKSSNGPRKPKATSQELSQSPTLETTCPQLVEVRKKNASVSRCNSILPSICPVPSFRFQLKQLA